MMVEEIEAMGKASRRKEMKKKKKKEEEESTMAKR